MEWHNDGLRIWDFLSSQCISCCLAVATVSASRFSYALPMDLVYVVDSWRLLLASSLAEVTSTTHSTSEASDARGVQPRLEKYLAMSVTRPLQQTASSVMQR